MINLRLLDIAFVIFIASLASGFFFRSPDALRVAMVAAVTGGAIWLWEQFR